MDINNLKKKLEHYEKQLETARVQLKNHGYSEKWICAGFEAQYKAELLQELLKDFKQDDENKIKVYKDKFCVSNYRIVSCVDNGELYWLAWTPDLGIDNSHRALFEFLEAKEGKYLHKDQRWCGFYTFGYGNGDQKHVDLYGESSDYPHINSMDDYAYYFGECAWEGFITSDKVKSMLKEEFYKAWK